MKKKGIDYLVDGVDKHTLDYKRPLITLSYAQSLDGSIAAERGRPLSLSSRESLILVHRLRAYHDAILVGIGTILSDNPKLNVRLVKGDDPQPIILDSHLRFPHNANLMKSRPLPWIVTTKKASKKREKSLAGTGLRVIRLKSNRKGWIDLHALMSYLVEQNIRSLMVEGGARVITSFLTAKLVDRFSLTIAPTFVGGQHALEERIEPNILKKNKKVIYPKIKILGSDWFGKDLVIWGACKWNV